MKKADKKSSSVKKGSKGIGLLLIAAFIVVLGLIVARGRSGSADPGSRSRAEKDTGDVSGTSSEEEKKVKIIFQGNRIASSHSSGIHIEGNRVWIMEAGTYVLRGRLDDGQIIVDAGKEDEIVLKLNNLSAHCETSSPLWIRKAGKVKIRLKDDSENSFSDGTYYQQEDDDEKHPKACIDARCDLNIKGEKGSLTVDAAYRDGIYSSDDLKIKSGNIKVRAERDALRSKDSVRIEDGDLDLTGSRDGIHTDGFLRLEGGRIRIDSARYGLYAFEEILAKSPASLAVKGSLSRTGCKGKIHIDQEVWQAGETGENNNGK